MRGLLTKLGLGPGREECDSVPELSRAASAAKVTFLHIHKTGGSTFRLNLQSIFGRRFHLCTDPSIASVEAAVAKFACVEFHTITYPTDWALAHQELVRLRRWDLLESSHNFTMLRDPVDQFLSLYYYQLRYRERFEPALKAQGLPFPDSIEMMLRHPAGFNDQLAYLVGRRRDRQSWSTRDDLDLAKEMLVRLKMHVGLTEHFADAMHIFGSVTGLKVPASANQFVNRNPERPPLESIGPDLLARIRLRSALDHELYEFGRGLFSEDVGRFGRAPKY